MLAFLAKNIFKDIEKKVPYAFNVVMCRLRARVNLLAKISNCFFEMLPWAENFHFGQYHTQP